MKTARQSSNYIVLSRFLLYNGQDGKVWLRKEGDFFEGEWEYRWLRLQKGEIE